MSESNYVLYGDHRSGNCWKVALVLSLLGYRWQWRETDVLRSETRTPAFLELNPNGKVPLLLLPDGRPLAESNALLLYLADGTGLLPEDRYERALAQQWLFFEQYSHEPYIAVARFLLHFDHGLQVEPGRMEMLHERGHLALGIMDGQLAVRPWIAGEKFTVADIALYAYTHVAGDGGFELDRYPALQRWMKRVAARPGHFDLEDLPA